MEAEATVDGSKFHDEVRWKEKMSEGKHLSWHAVEQRPTITVGII